MSRQSTGFGLVRVVAGLFAIAISMSTFAGAVRAQTQERPEDRDAVLRRARQHFLEGRKAFEGRRYPAALEEFQAGYDLAPRPAFLLDMAHAARKMGDLPRARELYQRFLATNPPEADRRVAEQMTHEIDRKQGAMPAAGTATETAATEPDAETAPVRDEPRESPDKETAPAAPASPLRRESLIVDPTMLGPVQEPQVDLTREARGSEPAQDGSSSTRWLLWGGLGALVAGAAVFFILRSGGGGDAGHGSGSWGQVKL